ncbi:MAG: hypothetical protein JXA14_18770 [Anaerolineae bacterium]|nr:hypothetical protein [Anaerolineae bacterium]
MAMSCYTDWKYIAAGDGGYAKGRNLLKYLQYRDDKINHIPRAGGPDRWVDCGLGGNWREILDNATELQTDKVLLRALIIRPPQELVAGLEEVDPERWANRRDLLEEAVHRVMDAEMERSGILRADGTKQPLDLPYSYVIHAPDDSNGVESPHAHVIVPAMDRDGERAFNVYRHDVQQTREVAERETERLFELSRVRDREYEPELEPEQEIEPISLDREIPFFEMDL